MSTNSQNDTPPPKNFAKDEAGNSWEFIRDILSNEDHMRQLGFFGGHDDEHIVMINRAGDRLHPTKGYDYLGPDWKNLDIKSLNRLQNERDHSAEKIFRGFLRVLKKEGYEDACRYAESASKFKVLYVSRTQSETEKSIQEMVDCGLGVNELTEDIIDVYGDYLVLARYENFSYYCRDTFINEYGEEKWAEDE